jgi:hypothetical protein
MFFWEGAMKEEQSPPMTPLATYFSVIRDPYPINEVIVITILAVIAMARGREDIERYGKAKEARLRNLLSREHGIPRHDDRRVMGRIKPEEVERCFMNRMRAVRKDYERKIIAIDGKTARGTFQGRDESPVYGERMGDGEPVGMRTVRPFPLRS